MTKFYKKNFYIQFVPQLANRISDYARDKNKKLDLGKYFTIVDPYGQEPDIQPYIFAYNKFWLQFIEYPIELKEDKKKLESEDIINNFYDNFKKLLNNYGIHIQDVYLNNSNINNTKDREILRIERIEGNGNHFVVLINESLKSERLAEAYRPVSMEGKHAYYHKKAESEWALEKIRGTNTKNNGIKIKRKSPAKPASEYKIGTIKIGLDKKKWISKKGKDKVKRWVRHS